MHGPDGKDYKNEIIYEEIVKPARIVFAHVSCQKFRVIATCAEDGTGTRLTFRMLCETTAKCERVRKYAIEANEQDFDRLEAELVRLAS